MLHVMDSITNILVIGGGNIGTQVACKCASKGYNVTILSSKPEEYDGTLEIVDEYNKILTGKIKYITNSLKDAMESIKQDMIFITYLAFKLKGLAEDIFPYITSGVIMCVMPGTGGAEFVFDGCIKVGAVLCRLQRVPSVARIEKSFILWGVDK
jgi:opine dehydrogenase